MGSSNRVLFLIFTFWHLATNFLVELVYLFPRGSGALCHQPINFSRCLWRTFTGLAFVSMSANWSSVWISRIVTRPAATAALKWWYLTLMCLVLGRMAGALARHSAPALSSNNLQCTTGIVCPTLYPLSLISCTVFISGIVLRRA
jgi:hypothetical protein